MRLEKVEGADHVSQLSWGTYSRVRSCISTCHKCIKKVFQITPPPGASLHFLAFLLEKQRQRFTFSLVIKTVIKKTKSNARNGRSCFNYKSVRPLVRLRPPSASFTLAPQLDLFCLLETGMVTEI